MKKRNLLILLVLLVVAAGAASFIVRHGETARTGRVENVEVFQRFTVNEVDSIEMRSGRDQVTCLKKDGVWVIPQRLDYPADFHKVAALLLRLKELRSARTFEADNETLGRLGVKAPEEADARPEEKGLRITLKNSDGSVAADGVVSAPRGVASGSPAPAGRYIRVTDETLIHVVKDDQKYFAWSANPLDWLDRVIVRIPREEVRRITCVRAEDGATVYSLSRKAKEDSLVPEGEVQGEITPLRLNQVAGGISPLAFEDVVSVDPAPPAPGDYPHHIDYELFDGRVIRVHTSQGSTTAEPFTVRVEEPPQAGSEAPRDLPRWIYKLPVPKHIAFIVRTEELTGN